MTTELPIAYLTGQDWDEMKKQTKRLFHHLTKDLDKSNFLHQIFLFRGRNREAIVYLHEDYPEFVHRAVQSVSSFQMAHNAWEVDEKVIDGAMNTILIDSENSAYSYEAAIYPLCDLLTEITETKGEAKSGLTVNLMVGMFGGEGADLINQAATQIEDHGLESIAADVRRRFQEQEAIAMEYTLPEGKDRLERLGRMVAAIEAVKEFAFVEIVSPEQYTKLFEGLHR